MYPVQLYTCVHSNSSKSEEELIVSVTVWQRLRKRVLHADIAYSESNWLAKVYKLCKIYIDYGTKSMWFLVFVWLEIVVWFATNTNGA